MATKIQTTEAVVSSTKDYELMVAEYVEETAGIPDAEIIFSRKINAETAALNAEKAVSSICVPAVKARIQDELHRANYEEMTDVKQLADTFAYADRKYSQPKFEAEKADLARGKKLARKQAAQLNLAVEFGIASKEEVAALKKGNSVLAVANRLTDGALLLKRIEPQMGSKMIVTKEQLDEATALGTLLRERVKQAAVKINVKPDADAMICARLWTLLVKRYDLVRRAAAWLWGDRADEFVPPLGARHAKRKAASHAAATPAGATPVAAPAATPVPVTSQPVEVPTKIAA